MPSKVTIATTEGKAWTMLMFNKVMIHHYKAKNGVFPSLCSLRPPILGVLVPTSRDEQDQRLILCRYFVFWPSRFLVFIY